MNTFKLLLYSFFLCLALGVGHISFAAHPVFTPVTMADSPRGERVYSVDAQPTWRSNNYNNQNRMYRRPYKNHDKEAKLALTFGILSCLYIWPLAIPALILGIIGADRRNRYYNRAVWGIVLGSIPIATCIVALIVVLLFI